MKVEKPWVEEVREFFGLLICVGVLAANWVYGVKERKKITVKKGKK